MSSSSRARRGGSGSLQQFPVGRWRHVAVVDAGCGCRPRRATTRLLSQLPSFLRPSPKPPQPPPPRSSSRSSSGFFPSSAASTASSSATTFTTTHSSHSNYDSSYTHHPTTTKHLASAADKPPAAAAGRRRQQLQGHHHHHQGSRRKKRYEKMGGPGAAADADADAAGEEGGVGVAVEKESSDPRADFRESMTQMVLEMGLCGWDDLRCMLRRLLALNAPRHHAAILAAFAEVCAQLTTAAPPYHAAAYDYDYHYHY